MLYRLGVSLTVHYHTNRPMSGIRCRRVWDGWCAVLFGSPAAGARQDDDPADHGGQGDAEQGDQYQALPGGGHGVFDGDALVGAGDGVHGDVFHPMPPVRFETGWRLARFQRELVWRTVQVVIDGCLRFGEPVRGAALQFVHHTRRRAAGGDGPVVHVLGAIPSLQVEHRVRQEQGRGRAVCFLQIHALDLRDRGAFVDGERVRRGGGADVFYRFAVHGEHGRAPRIRDLRVDAVVDERVFQPRCARCRAIRPR